MRLVIIESPYAGAVQHNLHYARQCVADALQRGEAPIASHLLYTQRGILDDDVPAERALGIRAGLAWQRAADAVVVYTDHGITEGMRVAIDAALRNDITIERRKITPAQHESPNSGPIPQHCASARAE